MAKLAPEVLAHLEWIGFARPTGLVVSAPALVRAGAILDRRDVEGQRLLRACVEERSFDASEGPVPYLPSFRAFAETVLGWNFSPSGYGGTAESPIPPELEVPLPEYNDTLRPDFAVREIEPQKDKPVWQLLVSVLEPGNDFDQVARGHAQLEASPHGRMERLLRKTGVSAGLLFNGRALRLLSAPYGESSGWVDFRLVDMVQTAGRPISTALRLLLGQSRLLSLPRSQRLAALLDDSRKFQNEVSERLAEQVLHALYELLRGFQAAHSASGGKLLRDPLAENPDEVYRALLTVLLRLVFLLYAEERDMLPEEEAFLRYYSLAGLHERLREDAALFPDTMDQRFGAWAQLLVLFRMVFDGADCGAMRLPKRHGELFDPDRFKFLEGRSAIGARQIRERIEPPLVPDGTIYRALEKLLILDGERISYRALDVEQIGSVYETMMGFRLETATGRSVAIKSQKKHGAPTTVDLEALLAEVPEKREKWLQDAADRKLAEGMKKSLKVAATLADLHAALLPVVEQNATPDLVPPGAMVLQPSEERRRSGSHYTPRSLTEPIVRTTLEPILVRLRGPESRPPEPDQILNLKVCDPAMGSGAFLVEACRQLGDTLVESWKTHGGRPEIPQDEDEVIFARRLVAQRCLYGVDKNPVAVDLAKVSLWLVTLAKDHALTFVDHALRHGDSLVGLSSRQLEALHWDSSRPYLKGLGVREPLEKASDLRSRIRLAGEGVADWQLRDMWEEAQFELAKIRLFGDLVLAAFFDEDRPDDREAKRSEYAAAAMTGQANRYRSWIEGRRHGESPFAPFHWEIEFPEVFEREDPGFDAIVGNPPFFGGNKISGTLGAPYLAWLQASNEGADGNSDLVAYFFRRSFRLLRLTGAAGLLATNTIGQGDTRRAGLGWIVGRGGQIYNAHKRFRWPGVASVIASVVHLLKCSAPGLDPKFLDGKRVSSISSFLLANGTNNDPLPLSANGGLCFRGATVVGDGFILGALEARRLIEEEPRNSAIVLPYLGGREINDGPESHFERYVINFGTRTLKEAQEWPTLLRIVEERVKPERDKRSSNAIARRQKKYWWRFRSDTPVLRMALGSKSRCIAACRIGSHVSLSIQSPNQVFADSTNVFVFDEWQAFCVLQSRSHEVWARFLGSSMKDDLRYNPSDCFETFPFPENWAVHSGLEAAGKVYYQFRAALMVQRDEGLTKTYNRFHNPDESDPEILKLRELHAAMDRATLDSYGWNEVPVDCEFLLDYEIEEEEWGDKKKPYRYRWPDEVRDEVLARLLELNAERAAEQDRSGAATTAKRGKKPAAPRQPKACGSGNLFS